MDDSAAMALTSARFLASAINPTLVLMLLGTPFFRSGRQLGSRQIVSGIGYRKWILFCALGVAIPVVLAESGKKLQIWNGHPSFPSGHETFAAAAATCLLVRHPRMAILALPVVAVLGWALVKAGYHEVVDVLGALVLGPVCAIATSLAFGLRQDRGKLASA